MLSDELSNILKSSKTCGKKRRRIIDEIFSTEQSYQEHLHLVTSVCISLPVYCIIRTVALENALLFIENALTYFPLVNFWTYCTN